MVVLTQIAGLGVNDNETEGILWILYEGKTIDRVTYWHVGVYILAIEEEKVY